MLNRVLTVLLFVRQHHHMIDTSASILLILGAPSLVRSTVLTEARRARNVTVGSAYVLLALRFWSVLFTPVGLLQ